MVDARDLLQPVGNRTTVDDHVVGFVDHSTRSPASALGDYTAANLACDRLRYQGRGEQISLLHDAVGTAIELEPSAEKRHLIEGNGLGFFVAAGHNRGERPNASVTTFRPSQILGGSRG